MVDQEVEALMRAHALRQMTIRSACRCPKCNRSRRVSRVIENGNTADMVMELGLLLEELDHAETQLEDLQYALTVKNGAVCQSNLSPQ